MYINECVFFCFLIFAHYSASFIRLKAAAITIENGFFGQFKNQSNSASGKTRFRFRRKPRLRFRFAFGFGFSFSGSLVVFVFASPRIRLLCNGLGQISESEYLITATFGIYAGGRVFVANSHAPRPVHVFSTNSARKCI